MLRKLGIIAVLSLIVTALAAVPALAVAPTTVTQTGGLHVCEGSALAVVPSTEDGLKTLTATGEVCGAGRTAEATLSATAEFTAGCITPSGSNRPRGLQEVTSSVVGSEAFPTRQGRGTFDVETSGVTLPATFDCPSAGMEEVIVGPVNFTDITLTITSQTGTIEATFPDIDP
jgi:hypothetical protein